MRLIHWAESNLKPAGGPPGYLFGLKEGLERVGIGGYDFIAFSANGGESTKDRLWKRLPKAVQDAYTRRKFLNIDKVNRMAPIPYDAYELIHFHSTLDLYTHRKALENFRGKVVLTSHSPCALHREFLAKFDPEFVNKHAEKLKALEQMDKFAFERADNVIFPCTYSEEPYFHTWHDYPKVRDESKLRYLPTGIDACAARVDRGTVRRRYGIPDDAFVVCYVGRHNQIKGYDSLVGVAEDILAHQNTWVLVAGNPGPVEAPSHARWVEAGWTDDPHSLIAASDVFVLPNRETYFDLVMLESLSLGQIVLATRTGGNKYFEGFGCKGILLYDDTDELLDCLSSIQEADATERARWGMECKRLYEEHFTLEKFARAYDETLDSLLTC